MEEDWQQGGFDERLAATAWEPVYKAWSQSLQSYAGLVIR